MFSVVDKANELTDGPPTPQPRRKHRENRGSVMGVGSPSAHSPSNPVNTRSNKPPLPPTRYSSTKIAKFPPGSIPLYQFLSIDHPTAPPWPLHHPLQANINPKCAVDLYSLSLFWHCPLGFTAKVGCSGGCSLPIVLPWLQDTPLQGGGQRDCGSNRSEGMAGNPKWSGKPSLNINAHTNKHWFYRGSLWRRQSFLREVFFSQFREAGFHKGTITLSGGHSFFKVLFGGQSFLRALWLPWGQSFIVDMIIVVFHENSLPWGQFCFRVIFLEVSL